MPDLPTTRPEDALHKAWLYRILTAFADDQALMACLVFKGGTCAAMQGWLDRFSVDLDFDLRTKDVDACGVAAVRARMEDHFADLGLTIKDASAQVPQYYLKHEAPQRGRSVLKVDVTNMPPAANTYTHAEFASIGRVLPIQTRETMFANKLVALTDRYREHGTIAGRDVYDIHYFFEHGYFFNEGVVAERTGKQPAVYLEELTAFIEDKVTQQGLDEDLNTLVPYTRFRVIRKTLKTEVLMHLRDARTRLES